MQCHLHRPGGASQGFFGTQIRSPAALPAAARRGPQAAQAGQKLAGTVVTVMDKTVTIEVTRTAQHPLYVKRVKKVKKFLAHDEVNKCKLGDYVSFVPDRPRSARKRWQVGRCLCVALAEGSLACCSQAELSVLHRSQTSSGRRSSEAELRAPETYRCVQFVCAGRVPEDVSPEHGHMQGVQLLALCRPSFAASSRACQHSNTLLSSHSPPQRSTFFISAQPGGWATRRQPGRTRAWPVRLRAALVAALTAGLLTT